MPVSGSVWGCPSVPTLLLIPLLWHRPERCQSISRLHPAARNGQHLFHWGICYPGMLLLCLDKFSRSRLNGFTDQLHCTAEQSQDQRAGTGTHPLLCLKKPCGSSQRRWGVTANCCPFAPNEHLPLRRQTQKTLNYYLENKYIEITVLASEAASGRIKALAAFLLS